LKLISEIDNFFNYLSHYIAYFLTYVDASYESLIIYVIN